MSNAKGRNTKLQDLSVVNNYTGRTINEGKGGGRKPRRKAKSQTQRVPDKQRARKPAKKTAGKRDQAQRIVTPEHAAHYEAAAHYVAAAFDTNVRSALPVHTNNPEPSNNAVPFQTVYDAHITIPVNQTTTTFGFPLGFGHPSFGNPMDGPSYHTNFLGIKNDGGTVDRYATGPCNVFRNGGDLARAKAGFMAKPNLVVGTVDPEAWLQTTVQNVSPLNVWDVLALPWDTTFPFNAVLDEPNPVHLRWAMVSAELIFYNDTKTSDKGGYFIVFEPTNAKAPLTSATTTLTETEVKKLPTFRRVPADNKQHRVVVRGRQGARDYWHNIDNTDGGGAERDQLNLANDCGLYLMYMNNTGAAQDIAVSLKVNWAIAGPILEGIGTLVPEAGLASAAIKSTLSNVNKGTVPPAAAASHVTSSLPDPGARAGILSNVAAKLSGAALAAAKTWGTSLITSAMN